MGGGGVTDHRAVSRGGGWKPAQNSPSRNDEPRNTVSNDTVDNTACTDSRRVREPRVTPRLRSDSSRPIQHHEYRYCSWHCQVGCRASFATNEYQHYGGNVSDGNDCYDAKRSFKPRLVLGAKSQRHFGLLDCKQVGGGLARPHSADSARGANAVQSVGVRNVPAVPDGPGLSPHSIPRWTVENRQFVDSAKPAISRVAKTSEFYFVASSERKSVWSFVRQLRGPHLSTCAW